MKNRFARSIFEYRLRIVLGLVFLLGIAAVYKYHSVNARSIAAQYDISYELNTTRGAGSPDTLEEAFKNKDWNKVVRLYNHEATKTAKYFFLAGIADLNLKQYPVAIEQFEGVLAENAKNHNSYFKDEAEYFLAFSYLMNDESGKALQLLAKIKQNKDHMYFPLTNELSSVDLKILAMKSR